MVFQDSITDACPVCHAPTAVAVIEPHPTRRGFEIHTFRCNGCGPTISKIVEIPEGVAAPGGSPVRPFA